MAHTAPPTPIRRRLELLFGVVLLLVGVSVAAIAVVALNDPQGQQAGASETFRAAGSTSAPASSPASRSSTASAGTASAGTVPSGAASSGTASATDGASSDGAAGGLSGSTSEAGKLPLIVLNNTSATPGSVAADRFRQAGWTVTDISTFTGDILSTAAYYDPTVAGASSAAAELQQEFPAIHRVKPKFEGLPEGPVVVVLTSDYS